MPLPIDERRRVEQIASQRAYEALRHSGLVSHVQDIAPDASQGIRPAAKKFSETVVLLEHAEDWGKPCYCSRQEAEQAVLFYQLSLLHVTGPGGTTLGYPSWLYFGKRKGHYGAAIDESAVQSKFLRTEDAQRYCLYLFFHELGHMLLHRNDLEARKVKHDMAWDRGGTATVKMELEADAAARRFGYECGGIVFPDEFYFREPESSPGPAA